jgi:glycosyltransferase involved in cell wall biosynthesis
MNTQSVEIVLPVRNEEVILESSVRRLHTFLQAQISDSWLITIAENGSSDRTSRSQIVFLPS